MSKPTGTTANTKEKIMWPYVVMLIVGAMLMTAGIVGISDWLTTPDHPTPEASTPQQVVEGFAELRPPAEEVIRLLNVEAKKQGVYWHLWCTAYYEGDKEEYKAMATKGGALNIYYEDGATDFWDVSKAASREEAAYALLKALQGPPNHKPQHRPRERRVACSEETLSGQP